MINLLQDTLQTSDDIHYSIHLTGLSFQTIKKISADQDEPQRMLDHRLKSLEIYHQLPMPKR